MEAWAGLALQEVVLGKPVAMGIVVELDRSTFHIDGPYILLEADNHILPFDLDLHLASRILDKRVGLVDREEDNGEVLELHQKNFLDPDHDQISYHLYLFDPTSYLDHLSYHRDLFFYHHICLETFAYENHDVFEDFWIFFWEIDENFGDGLLEVLEERILRDLGLFVVLGNRHHGRIRWGICGEGRVRGRISNGKGG